MAEYINMNRMYEEVRALLLEVRDEYVGQYIADNEEEEVMEEYQLPSDEWVESFAKSTVQTINDDMGKYLNANDHKIWGCACNIATDYCAHTTGIYLPDKQLVEDLVHRLESNDQSPETQSDKDFLVDWYWKAFGTFGITENFRGYL